MIFKPATESNLLLLRLDLAAPSCAEELAQQVARLLGEDAGGEVDAVVEAGVLDEVLQRAAIPLWIGGGQDAHTTPRARFERRAPARSAPGLV